MIDEHRQDLAAEYALDALDADSTRAFEALLTTDPELKALADDLRETAAALAHTAPAHLPPPEIRERVLSRIRAEAQSVTPPTMTPVSTTPQPPAPASKISVLPWAIAAGFAITTAALWMERDQLQKETAELKNRIGELQHHDALDKMQIAMLSAQVESYSKASAVIVWDKEKKQGVVKLANLPRPPEGKDYQLWVIDPKYPKPVNGGVVPMAEEGVTRVAFTPDQPIRKAEKFAISVEKAGGVPNGAGPIIFLGD